MTISRRTPALLALGALTVGSLAACGSDSASTVDASCTPTHTFDTIADGKLTVSAPEFPPFSSVSGSTGKGIDADIVSAIAEKECLEVSYLSTTYAAAIPAVQSGRADLAIGDYYRTAARAEVVALTDAIYFDQMAVISADGLDTIAGIEDAKVGTVDGYLWLEDMQAILGDNLSVYPSNVEMKADLEAGRIDVGLDSYAVAAIAFEGTDFTTEVVQPDERVAASLEPAQTTLPHTKDNTALTEALNADIATLREDGTLAEIFDTWGLDTSATEITENFELR